MQGHAEEEYPPLPPVMIDGLMYPPGHRLGIELPAGLHPGHNGVWSELMSDDQALAVSFHLRGRGQDDNDDLWWNPLKPDEWRLVSSEKLDDDVERQLFANPDNDETKSGNAAFFMSFRTGDLFEGLDVRSIGPADLGWIDPTKTAYKRWRPTMERILASARLRAPVSVLQLMNELAIAVDFAGYFARHRGPQLILTPQPQGTPGVTLPDDGVITVVAQAALSFLPTGPNKTRDDLVASFAKLTAIGGGRQLSSNGIEWFIPPEFDARRDDLVWTDADGIGQKRGVGIKAWYRRPHRDATLAVFEDVVKSFRFL